MRQDSMHSTRDILHHNKLVIIDLKHSQIFKKLQRKNKPPTGLEPALIACLVHLPINSPHPLYLPKKQFDRSKRS